MASEPRKNGAKGPRILIVDDDPGQRSLLDSFLRSQGFETVTVGSGEEALKVLSTGGLSMMISDVRMPGLSGLETMHRARQENAVLPILLVTAYADIREAVGAMRDGALNYLAKPIDLDELLTTVQQATGIAQPAPLKFSTDKQLPPHVVARSPLIQAVFHDASLIASSESRILITGESGVGKEVLADVIHAWSPRASGPLVKVNCAAIPTGLIESELFGHEKGAFTGAIGQKIGRFELADKGTLFLDEIGDIPLELQPKLLRVLQEREFERLGSTRTVKVDIRLVTATNRDLSQMIASREFREDLFYRLNVFPIPLPPLRERREDIPLLVRYFTQKYARRMNRPIETIPTEAMEALTNWNWPGNVRELENLIERAVILTRGAVLHVPLAELRNGGEAAAMTGAPTTLEEAEREHILRALRESKWVVGGPAGAAARLGLKRTTLQSRMQKLGIARGRA